MGNGFIHLTITKTLKYNYVQMASNILPPCTVPRAVFFEDIIIVNVCWVGGQRACPRINKKNMDLSISQLTTTIAREV